MYKSSTYTQNWLKENNYINPPFNQLEQILSKIKEENTTCTVIAPLVHESADDDSKQMRHISPRSVGKHRAAEQPELGSGI